MPITLRASLALLFCLARPFCAAFCLPLQSTDRPTHAPSICDYPRPGNGRTEEARKAFELSNQLLRDHQNEAAIHAAAHSIELQSSADGWYQLALARFTAGYAECSLQAFTQAATLRLPDGEELRIVALDYVLLNAPADAEKWLKASLAKDEKNSEAWYDLGRVFYGTARYEEAAGALKQSMTLKPQQARVDTYLGLISEMKGDSHEAELRYRAALVDTDNPTGVQTLPLRSLGALLCSSNRAGEGAENVEHALMLEPNEPENHVELGRCYAALEHLPAAKEQFEIAVQQGDDSAALHYALGRVDRSLGLNAEASLQFTQAKQRLDARNTSERK